MNKQIDLDFIKQDFYRKKLREFLEILFESSTKIKVKGVLLYGSLARGEAKKNNISSDIDLIVIVKDLPKDYWKRHKKVEPIIENTSAYIEPLWWTSKEMKNHVKNKFYLVLDALDEGKILYDPDNFLPELRNQLFLDLAKKGVIKTEYYWQWPIKKFGDKIEF